MDEQELVQFLKQAGKVSLSFEKKSAFREELLLLARTKPLPRRARGAFMTHFLDTFTVKRFVSSGMIAVLALFLAGGGISFAAEKALPGEVLYPVKRNVNERVRETLALTPQAKADWGVEVTKRRIDEADELSTQGKLSDVYRKDIEDETSRSAEQVGKLVQNLETQSDTEKARQVEKNLNEALRGGKKIHAETIDNKIIIHEGERGASEKQSILEKQNTSKQDGGAEKKDTSEQQDAPKQGD